MTYLQKLATLPLPVQDAIHDHRAISYTEIGELERCALQWHFKRVLHLPSKPSEAMDNGNLFDSLVEGGLEVMDGRHTVTSDDLTIRNRYCEYRDLIFGTDHKQFPVWVDLGDGRFFYGFVDVFREVPELVVIDQKFSAEPWKADSCKEVRRVSEFETSKGVTKQELDTMFICTGGKSAMYHAQAQHYMWALNRMGYPVKEFWFDVSNLASPGIQRFIYHPTAKALDKVGEGVVQCLSKRNEIPIPTGGHHCNWCDYYLECDKVMMKEGTI